MSIAATKSPVAMLGLAAALLTVASCGDDGGGTTPTSTSASSAGSTAPTSSSNQPSAFDPCTALTPDFLAKHQWDARPPKPRQDTSGQFSWKGCLFVARTTYTFRVETTNGTLDQVQQQFPAAAPITVAGHKAVRYEAAPEVPGGCTVNIQMQSGSLYILVDDPRGLHPRKLSPCDSATEIAEAVAPLLPASN